MIHSNCVRTFLAAAVVLLVCSSVLAQAPSNPAPAANSSVSPIARQYREGEKLTYHMICSNRDRAQTINYEIQADGVVKKNDKGFFEEYAWSGLTVGGNPFSLPQASLDLRQVVSLAPNAGVAIPDLSKVSPMMIGPITDLLTIYADMMLANSNGSLRHPGDHFYLKHGAPNSWADGSYVALGQDSIDFDVTLEQLDRSAGTALVVVRHVPPEKPQIKIPAEWMNTPVADTPNNWVEVSKTQDGKYAAHIGKETFEVRIKLSLADGRIVSATIHNPVEVIERECSNAELSDCGTPQRYQILREVELK